MGGIKFLITLFVVYLVFRTVMKKVLGAVNPEGGPGGLKGKLGEMIGQVKDEIEKARLEAQREASGMDPDNANPWADLRGDENDAFGEGDRLYYEEDLSEEVMMETPSSSHERWNEEDESSSYWDRVEEEETPSPVPCPRKRKTRSRLKDAIIWKEILDQPVGMR